MGRVLRTGGVMIQSSSTSFKFLKVFIFSFLFAAPLVSMAENKPLDGQAFEIEMLPKGSEKPIENTLTFKSGTFLSAVCVKHDFPQSDYLSYEKDGVIHFEVDAESYTKGNMVWKGTVNESGELEAKAVWNKPDADKPVEFEIKGKKKK